MNVGDPSMNQASTYWSLETRVQQLVQRVAERKHLDQLHRSYPLVMTHSLPWLFNGPFMAIEIDGLPSKHGDFPWQTVSHNPRVYGISPNIKPFGDIYPRPNHHGDVTHRQRSIARKVKQSHTQLRWFHGTLW